MSGLKAVCVVADQKKWTNHYQRSYPEYQYSQLVDDLPSESIVKFSTDGRNVYSTSRYVWTAIPLTQKFIKH